MRTRLSLVVSLVISLPTASFGQPGPDEVIVFINRSAGASWEEQVLSTQGSHCIQAGDIDSDGDIDLLGANWSGPYQPVEMWQNESGRSR